MLVTVFVSVRNEFREFQSFSGAVIIWLVSSALCDVMIAAVLTYSLVCFRSYSWVPWSEFNLYIQWTRKTGFTAVDGQINRIIRCKHPLFFAPALQADLWV